MTATMQGTLRNASRDRLLVGTALMAAQLEDPAQAMLVEKQFNCITPENEMKPIELQRVRGQFTFEPADRIVAFAKAHRMVVIGHTLVWHNQSPAWLYEDEQGRPLSRDEALENMREHIEAVMGHYRGQLKGWDVVNEAVPDEAGELRDTPARRAIGDDYVLKAFEFAHAADPTVELYYNDYNIDQDYKRDRALRLVKQIRSAGLRIDAVGIQGHYMLTEPKQAEIERGVNAFVEAGFKVMITEFDVDPLPRSGSAGADLGVVETQGMDPYRDGLPSAMQAALAERYESITSFFLRSSAIGRMSFWGFSDRDTWLNHFPIANRVNHPMLFDRSLQPKPAFDAVWRAFSKATSPG